MKNVLTGVVTALFLLVLVGLADATTIELSSIYDISDGTTIDFESPGSASDILNSYNMGHTAGSERISTMVSWVEGNADAPLQNNVLFGSHTITATDDGWSQIGISGIGSVMPSDKTFGMVIYDINSIEIARITNEMSIPEYSPDGQPYNNTVEFIGFRSTESIYSFDLFCDSNFVWDSLTFTNASEAAPVPEPATLFLLGSGLLGIAGSRKKLRDKNLSK